MAEHTERIVRRAFFVRLFDLLYTRSDEHLAAYVRTATIAERLGVGEPVHFKPAPATEKDGGGDG